jgi:osmoprotectant transport system permease protein
MAWVIRNHDQVVRALWEHLVLTGMAVGIGLAIALAVGVVAARRPVIYRVAVAVAGLFYTIPSLALFAVLIPVVGLGRTPAVIGLVGYSLLALIRNTVAGLHSVPAEVREAAVAVGFGDRQRLWQVELPLALPVILAGIRVVTVTVIGIATVAAYVNAGELGALIFTGLAQGNGGKAAAGGGGAAALAVGADLLLGWLQRRAARGAGR